MAVWNRKRGKPRRVERLRPEGDLHWHEHLRRPHVRRVVGVVTVLVAALVLVVQLPRPPLPYPKGARVPHPILARVDFEYIDHDATAAVRELTALLQVPDLYKPNPRPALDLRERLLEMVEAVAKAATLEEVPTQIRETWNLNETVFDTLKQALGQGPTVPDQARQAVTDATALLADPANLPVLLEVDYQRAAGRVSRIRELRKQLPAGLAPETASILQEPQAEIILQLPEGDQTLPLEKVATVTQTDRLEGHVRRLIEPALGPLFGPEGLGRLAAAMAPRLGPTLVFDQATTENRRAEVKAKVQPVPVLRKKGTTLVEAGKEITDTDLKILAQEQAAYLARLGPVRKVLAWAGALVVVLALVLIEAAYTSIVQPRIGRSLPRAVMLTLLVVGVVGLAKAAAQVEGFTPGPMAVSAFLVTTATLIIAIAYDQPFALALGWMLALLVAVAVRADLDWTLATMAGAGSTAVVLGEINNRSKLIKVGALAGLVLVLTHAGLRFWRLVPVDGSPWEVLETTVWPAALLGCGGLAAGILMLAILPFIERIFGIVTNISLLELCDVNQPALKRLALEAPGTYAHSLLIGTLAEAAAEAIGASGLLARVGAYFHDIGKANKPRYFVENCQADDRPHERLSPAMSRLIIASHVKDGLEMADRLGLPPLIKDFIAQHHGTTLMEYFYHEAKKQAEQAGETPPDENDYRYPGPKPQRPETAIVMLADAVEGAARSLKDRTAPKIKTAVHDMISKRLLDGQLDESGLTMNDLKRIEEALTRTLLSVYHGRITYPGQGEDEAPEPTGDTASGDRGPATPSAEASVAPPATGPAPEQPAGPVEDGHP